MPKSTLAFSSCSFFHVFYKTRKSTKKRKSSFLQYLPSLLLCFESLGGPWGPPGCSKWPPETLPRGPLSPWLPKVVPWVPKGSPQGPPRDPPEGQNQSFLLKGGRCLQNRSNIPCISKVVRKKNVECLPRISCFAKKREVFT